MEEWGGGLDKVVQYRLSGWHWVLKSSRSHRIRTPHPESKNENDITYTLQDPTHLCLSPPCNHSLCILFDHYLRDKAVCIVYK
jgi:hypothetical protein